MLKSRITCINIILTAETESTGGSLGSKGIQYSLHSHYGFKMYIL